ncbi:hypothetical protein FA09DRAFT_304330, partial [Tilletiopsis washingtonensis]
MLSRCHSCRRDRLHCSGPWRVGKTLIAHLWPRLAHAVSATSQLPCCTSLARWWLETHSLAGPPLEPSLSCCAARRRLHSLDAQGEQVRGTAGKKDSRRTQAVSRAWG